MPQEINYLNDNRMFATAIFMAVIGLAIAFLLTPFGYKVLQPGAVQSQYLFKKIPFDSRQWKTSKRFDGQNNRLRMLDSLRSGHKLVGLNVLVLEDLLGKSDARSYGHNQGFQYCYWLSPRHNVIDCLFPFTLNIHDDWFCVKVENDIVTVVEILGD